MERVWSAYWDILCMLLIITITIPVMFLQCLGFHKYYLWLIHHTLYLWFMIFVIFFSAFQVACDSMNKGFHSYIQRHRALRLASIMVAPWFIPADVVYNYTLRYKCVTSLSDQEKEHKLLLVTVYTFIIAKTHRGVKNGIEKCCKSRICLNQMSVKQRKYGNS
jgi:energy-coupling factor transporter transmembrane protein EcfT